MSGNVIWTALDRPGDDRPHLHTWEGNAYQPHTWDDWRRGAERAAAGLQAHGVRPGMRVAAVLTNTFGVCTAILGAWMSGATVLSLPTMRRGIEVSEYVDQLKSLCASAGAHLLLLEDRFSAFLDADAVGVPIVSFDTLARDGRPELSLLEDHEPAFVQYSSGSTSEPKGILLSMGAVGKQEEMLADRLHVNGDSQGVMWLPLSHDMGLFGCVLLSWAFGMRLAVSTPERFLRRPQTWFDDAHDLQANITAAPNFGLALATRKARTTPPKGSCPMKTVVLGGERIELPTLDAAQEVLGPYGITRETITPAYGLAEGTLAVTMKPYGEVPGTVWIDRESAYAGEVRVTAERAEGSTAVVSCGPPVRGVTVSVDAELGRIQLTSESLAEGYLNNPEATAKSFRDGTFQTEDLGFMHEGELFVLGRTDDVIVISGRNVPARDIERDMELHEGVRPGCCVLIDGRREGEPHIVALVEPSNGGDANFGEVADELADTAYRSGGLRIAECVFVKPGQLPKTPSGKIQRFRCRALLAGDGAALLERVAM